MSRFKLELIRDFEKVSDFSVRWDELVADQQFGTVYQLWGFHAAWWKAFGSSCSPYVIIVRDRDEVVSILPLIIHNDGGRILSFWGSPNFDYHDIIGNNSEAVLCEFLTFIKDHSSDWDEVLLEQLSERSETALNLARIAERMSFNWMKRESDRCHYFAFEGNEEQRAEYTLRKGRNHKKAVNHFNRLGGFELRRIVDRRKAGQILDAIFHMHITRWKDTPSPSKFITADNRLFYHEIMNGLWDSGNICLMELNVAGVPTAASLNFEMSATIYHYTVSYTKYFSRRSPGSFFVTLQSEALVRNGFNLDFCRGSQDYKDAISSHSYANFELRLFRSPLAASKIRLYESVKNSSLVKRLTTNPSFMRKKFVFDAFAARHGKPAALLKILAGAKAKPAPPIYRFFNIDPHELPSSSGGVEKVRQLEATDEFRLASFMGVLDESEEMDLIRDNFRSGDAYFAAETDGIIVGVVRLTESTRLGANLPANFVFPDNTSAILTDLTIAETGAEREICAALLSEAIRQRGVATAGLLVNLNSFSNPKFLNCPGLKQKRSLPFRT